MIEVEFEFRAKGEKVIRRATLSLPCMPPMGYFVSRSIFGPMQPGDDEKPLLVIKDALLSMRKWPTDPTKPPSPYVLAICKEPN
jgi:hypothetical protein